MVCVALFSWIHLQTTAAAQQVFGIESLFHLMVINNFPKKETGPLMPLVAPCRRCSQHSTAAFHPPLPSSTVCAGSWGSSHLLMWLHLWQHFKKWWKQHDLKCQSKSIGVWWAFLWEGEKAQEYSSWPPFCIALYVLSGGLWIWGGFHCLQDFQGRLWSSESNTNPYRSNNLIKLGYKYCIGNETHSITKTSPHHATLEGRYSTLTSTGSLALPPETSSRSEQTVIAAWCW